MNRRPSQLFQIMNDSAIPAIPRAQRQVLPISAVIPSGKTAIVTAKPRSAFRVERITISPQSFPLSLARRAWTWPLVVIGGLFGRVHRRIAKLLRVDLYAPREQREYIEHTQDIDVGDLEAAQDRGYVITPSGDEVFYDEDLDGYYRIVPIPLNQRERFLAPIGRDARRLGGVRLAWQNAQLAYLTIDNVTVGKASQFAQAGALPADMFATNAIDTFVSFDSCAIGQEIAIEISNGNSRECRLMMALIGTGHV